MEITLIDTRKPHKIWFDKYECFGVLFGQIEYCDGCKDWYPCRYDYYDGGASE
jgi:hypothetical protein